MRIREQLHVSLELLIFRRALRHLHATPMSRGASNFRQDCIGPRAWSGAIDEIVEDIVVAGRRVGEQKARVPCPSTIDVTVNTF